MFLKNIGKNVICKLMIFDIKNILVIYDFWFYSDKKIKNRFLNDEFIWERIINIIESKVSKKNFFFFFMYMKVLYGVVLCIIVEIDVVLVCF